MTGYVEPVVTELNRPFWDGCREGVLRMQRCANGHLRFPIAPWCPVCLASDYHWEELSGKGTVLSSIVFHQGYHAAWRDRLPYNVVLVQLAEGARMLSNVVPLSAQDVAVGVEVEVMFEVEGAFVVPRFRFL